MKKTWYLFPGQTLENTKIKDRGKALIATKSAIKKITDHLDRRKVQQELIDEELAHLKFLKDGSYNMTKDWDNSIEKMQQRRLEEHDLKVKAREENLYKRFMELKQEQAEERKRIVDQCKKKIIMINKDSRVINSSLLLTEVLHERNLQIEFDRGLKNVYDDEENRYAELVTYNAGQEKIENAKKKQMIREKNIKHSEEIKQQIKEKHDKLKQETEEKVREEIKDHERAAKEIKAIEQYEYLVGRKKKDEMKQQFHSFKKEQKEREEEARKQSESEDKIVEICARGRCRIDNILKQKNKEAHEKRLMQIEKIANKVFSENQNKGDEFNRILDNATKEREKREAQVLKEKEAYAKSLRDDRIEYRKKCLLREEEKKKRKKELEKWDMANRLKATEITKIREHTANQAIFDEKIQYRYELDKQIQENKDRLAYENECEKIYNKIEYDTEDKEFFEYGQEVMDLAKSRGRTTKHIEKVIHQYKVNNDLEPRKKTLPHLNSKVPINEKK